MPCEERIVMLANNSSVLATHWDEVLLEFDNANIRLNQALFIPLLGYNLVSAGRLAINGIESRFRRHDGVLEPESDKSVIGYGSRDPDSKMYVLSVPLAPDSCAVFFKMESPERELWHRLLAHINIQDMTRVHKFVDDMPKLSMLSHPCRACKMGKAHTLPFLGHIERASRVGKTVYSDVVGELELSIPDRFQYLCPFLEDHLRYTFLRFLSTRIGVNKAFSMMISRLSTMI